MYKSLQGRNTRKPRGEPTASAVAEEMSVYSKALSVQILLNFKNLHVSFSHV